MMSDAFDKLAAFCSGLEMKIIHVPELDMDIYVKPLSLEKQKRIVKRLSVGNEVEASLDAVIILAEDSRGEAVFTIEDKPKIMRLNGAADMIIRLAGELLNAFVLDPEELEKN